MPEENTTQQTETKQLREEVEHLRDVIRETDSKLQAVLQHFDLWIDSQVSMREYTVRKKERVNQGLCGLLGGNSTNSVNR